jgi:hypothetical protein
MEKFGDRSPNSAAVTFRLSPGFRAVVHHVPENQPDELPRKFPALVHRVIDWVIHLMAFVAALADQILRTDHVHPVNPGIHGLDDLVVFAGLQLREPRLIHFRQ